MDKHGIDRTAKETILQDAPRRPARLDRPVVCKRKRSHGRCLAGPHLKDCRVDVILAGQDQFQVRPMDSMTEALLDHEHEPITCHVPTLSSPSNSSR